jgi:hypothetical protein
VERQTSDESIMRNGTQKGCWIAKVAALPSGNCAPCLMYEDEIRRISRRGTRLLSLSKSYGRANTSAPSSVSFQFPLLNRG